MYGFNFQWRRSSLLHPIRRASRIASRTIRHEHEVCGPRQQSFLQRTRTPCGCFRIAPPLIFNPTTHLHSVYASGRNGGPSFRGGANQSSEMDQIRVPKSEAVIDYRSLKTLERPHRTSSANGHGGELHNATRIVWD